ncbi:MAG: hypothetical protein WCD89_22775 [Anaerocolumna sp.]
MSKHLSIYNPEKTYLYPNMKEASPNTVKSEYSSVNFFTCVFETDASETVIYTSPEPMQVIRSRYEIDSSLSDEEAIIAIEVIMNTPQPVIESAPSAEERIAAAMEYKNLLSI